MCLWPDTGFVLTVYYIKLLTGFLVIFLLWLNGSVALCYITLCLCDSALLCVYAFICLFFCVPILLRTYAFAYLCFCVPTFLFTYTFMYLCFCLLMLLCTYTFVYLCFWYLRFCLPMLLFTYTFMFLCLCVPILFYISLLLCLRTSMTFLIYIYFYAYILSSSCTSFSYVSRSSVLSSI